MLAVVAEQASFSIPLSHNSKGSFSHDVAQMVFLWLLAELFETLNAKTTNSANSL